MIENGILQILADLIDHKNHSIKINCMWALMNLAFQADHKTKQLILSSKSTHEEDAYFIAYMFS